jgi:hypothetical protein
VAYFGGRSYWSWGISTENISGGKSSQVSHIKIYPCTFLDCTVTLFVNIRTRCQFTANNDNSIRLLKVSSMAASQRKYRGRKTTLATVSADRCGPRKRIRDMIVVEMCRNGETVPVPRSSSSVAVFA